jgi:phospholipid-binding lipoprotein MlaA
MTQWSRGGAAVRRFAGNVVVVAVLATLLGGCGTASSVFRIDQGTATSAAPDSNGPARAAELEPADHSAPALPATPTVLATPASTEPPVVVPAAAEAGPDVVAQATTEPAPSLEPTSEEAGDQYDPWEKFNEKMFNFNYKVDRYVLKPAANVYRHVMPEPFQILIRNGFDNIRWVPRFVNNLLQGKVGGAGRELARFLINSTAGIGGLFDPAKDYWGIKGSNEDFGQTLGVWGSGPGPYLVLPLTEPMTVRDGIGRGVDLFLDPLSYFLPFFWDRLGMKIGDTLNERALNYELFQGVEETTLDLYSSVRHFYLKRREQQIKE